MRRSAAGVRAAAVLLACAGVVLAGCRRDEAPAPAPGTGRTPIPGMNEALAEALHAFRARAETLKAAENPERFVFAFEHLVEEFPPLQTMQALPGARRKETADLLNGFGIALQHLDRAEEAEDRFRAAIALWPEERAYWFNLGILEVQMGRFDGAERTFRGLLDEGNLAAEQEVLCLGWLKQIADLKAQRDASRR